jgi:hypothetical protein
MKTQHHGVMTLARWPSKTLKHKPCSCLAAHTRVGTLAEVESTTPDPINGLTIAETHRLGNASSRRTRARRRRRSAKPPRSASPRWWILRAVRDERVGYLCVVTESFGVRTARVFLLRQKSRKRWRRTPPSGELSACDQSLKKFDTNVERNVRSSETPGANGSHGQTWVFNR